MDANVGFVDAMSIGILLSAILMVVPIAVAALFLPGRTRTEAVEEVTQPGVALASEEAVVAA